MDIPYAVNETRIYYSACDAKTKSSNYRIPANRGERANDMFNIDRAIGFDAVAGATILTMALAKSTKTNMKLAAKQIHEISTTVN